MAQPKAKLAADVAALAPRLQRWAHALAAGEAAPGAPLAAALAGAGFSVRTDLPELPHAFVADWQGAPGGPRLVLLAEYDEPAPAGEPPGEAPAPDCQHHLTGAAMTGAAVALAGLGASLPGALRVLGMPVRPGGRLRLQASGLLEGAAAAFLAHPGEQWQAGIATLALLPLSFVFYGRAAHASAAPDQGINALDACIGLFNAIAALRQHLPPWQQVHGIISDGGQAPNRVPERAAALLYLRAPDDMALAALAARVRAAAEGAAAAVGARVEVAPAAPALVAFSTSGPLAAAFARNLQSMGAGPLQPPGPPAGSSDAGNLSAALPCLCAVFPPTELTPVARALALTLFDALTQPELLRRAAAEHAAQARQRAAVAEHTT